MPKAKVSTTNFGSPPKISSREAKVSSNVKSGTQKNDFKNQLNELKIQTAQMINRNEISEPIPSSTKEEIPMEIDEGPKRAPADA